MDPVPKKFWKLILSRDDSLNAARKVYDNWIGGLNEQLESQKAYLETVEKDRVQLRSDISTIQDSLLLSQKALEEVRTDSDARLTSINQMQEQLDLHGKLRHIAESRCAELEQSLRGTQGYLASVEADRALQLEHIDLLRRQLSEMEQGHARTVAYLSAVEADSANRLQAIYDLQAQLKALQDGHEGTVKYLKEVEADSAKRLDLIVELQARIAASP
jgi:septal ring factor EnvC (AmiA/AmiB activator)